MKYSRFYILKKKTYRKW